jgi:hypothetical protein
MVGAAAWVELTMEEGKKGGTLNKAKISNIKKKKRKNGTMSPKCNRKQNERFPFLFM